MKTSFYNAASHHTCCLDLCFPNSFNFFEMSLFWCNMYSRIASLSNRYPSGLHHNRFVFTNSTIS